MTEMFTQEKWVWCEAEGPVQNNRDHGWRYHADVHNGSWEPRPCPAEHREIHVGREIPKPEPARPTDDWHITKRYNYNAQMYHWKVREHDDFCAYALGTYGATTTESEADKMIELVRKQWDEYLKGAK